MKKLSIAKLRNELNYDPQSGVFTWAARTSNRIVIGAKAGTLDKTTGYTKISIGGQQYYAHRLAIAYVEWNLPPNHIDHANGDRTDNRYLNLRKATHAENHQNLTLRVTNTSGSMGVSWSKVTNKWAANIWKENKRVYLGVFESIEAASAAYLNAKKVLHTFNPLPR